MSGKGLSYRRSGVDIAAGEEAVRRIAALAGGATSEEVISGIGGFGGAYRLPSGEVLVAGADGVGSKLEIAFALGKHDSVGIDLVAMNANDVVAAGARPLFFLDYLAMGKVEPALVEAVLAGIVDGCQQAGCSLLGGETAELPSFYEQDRYELAGFCLGLATPWAALDKQVRAGDVLLGLPSSGLHSNGFSLVRAVVESAGLDYHAAAPWDSSLSLGEALLEPTRLYAKPVRALLEASVGQPLPGDGHPVKGLAHITGGGLVDNLPRVLAHGQEQELGFQLLADCWPRPPVFDWLQQAGQIEAQEMQKVFNLGLGFVLVIDPAATRTVEQVLAAAGETCYRVGFVVDQPGVHFDGELGG